VLPGFPFTVGADSGNFSGWSYMPNAHWFRFMAYLLNWHSNAFIVADWKPDAANLASYDFVVRTADGGNLYEQMHQQALALVPDNHFTCNRLGQLTPIPQRYRVSSPLRRARVLAWARAAYHKANNWLKVRLT
jgi:hypothetical protein